MDERKRRPSSLQGKSDEIKDALVNSFDLVVAFLAADTGIKLTDRVLEEMLDDFSKIEGMSIRQLTSIIYLTLLHT